VINGALVYLRSEFNLTPFETEMVASVLLWGCAAGAAIAGYTSDRYGRRAVLFVAGVFFCLSSLGSALPTHLWQLILARAVGGLAIGSASLIAPLYIAEIAPANVRGRLVTLNQLAIVCGILVAFVSNGALAHLAGRAVSMNVSVGIINLVFTLAALLLIDRLGRRPLLLTATAGMGVCMTIFAAMLRWTPERSGLLLIPVLGYVTCFAFGFGPGVWVCLAEFFPNHIRGRAMSIATVALWLAVSLVTSTFLTLIRYFSAPTVFLGYALLCAASFVYIYRQLPETKNRTLEEIQSL
jgi:MFS family permease